MSKQLNVLIDTSGSMAEDCKNAVVKYLINTIASHDEYEIKNYYLIGDQYEHITDVTGLKILYGGQITASAVNGYFREISGDTKTLLISDGCIDSDAEKSISAHRDAVVCVAVGEDAMLGNLQRCSKDKKAYLAEDVTAAIAACW